MQKRVTKASSGGQKRQVRMLQRRLESSGVSTAEARSRATARSTRLGQSSARQGGRLVSKRAERAELAERPKSRKGIKMQGGRVTLPRRITAKREEAVRSGRLFGKRATKARK